jgi:hypothetical protein
MSDIESLAGGRSPADAIEIDSDIVAYETQEATEPQGEYGDVEMSGVGMHGDEHARGEVRGGENIGQRRITSEDLDDATLLLQFTHAARARSPPSLANPPSAASASSPLSAAASSPLSSAVSLPSSPVNTAAPPPDAPALSNGPTIAKAAPATTKVVKSAQAAPQSRGKAPIAAAKPERKSNTGVKVSGFTQKKHLKGGVNGEETYERHPTDPNLIIAQYRVKNPGEDTYYHQINQLREIDSTKTPLNPPQFVMEPDLGQHKVPRRVRANKMNGGVPVLFVEDAKTGVWTRAAGAHGPEVVWTPCIMFRRLDSETGEYLQPYVNVERLHNIDPNDKDWSYAYNKWLDQIKRRRDSTYEQVVLKHHWSHAERAALYEAINAFIAKSGLHSFDSGYDMSNKDIQVMTDAVNNVGGMGRGIDAVRGQITSSHGRKNKAIWELRDRAKAMRQRIGVGERIARAEQYPQEAIPRSQFPEIKEGKVQPRRSTKSQAHTNIEDDTEEDQDMTMDMRMDVDREVPPPTVPWYIASPPSAAAVLALKGSGIPSNRPERETDWEIEDVEEDWASVDEELSGEEDEENAEEDSDHESAWEDMSASDPDEDTQQGVEGESAITSPIEDEGVASPFRGVTPPTHDSDFEASAPVTPSAKRKRVLDDEDGEPESFASPQRSIKKARGMTSV